MSSRVVSLEVSEVDEMEEVEEDKTKETKETKGVLEMGGGGTRLC